MNLFRLALSYYEFKKTESEKERFLIFYDLSKAFDSCSRTILKDKLKEVFYYSTQNNDKKLGKELFNGFLNFMDNAKLNFGKEQIKLNKGVNQGDSCSPLAFNLIMDSFKEITEVYGLYAEDSYQEEKTEQEAIYSIKNTKEWAIKNEFEINYKKSNVLKRIKRKTRNLEEPLKIFEEIRQVESVKYLGITIDEKMTLDNHKKQISKN